jgi:alpha-ribazole phosphatase
MDEHLVVTLLRHGLTAENEKHAYIGWSDVPLSQKGREQLRLYRPLHTNYDLYVSSDLKRCIETAEILFPGQPFVACSSFREIHFGEWEGKTYEELKDQELYQEWLKHPFTVCFPGGEGFYHFTKRIDKGWRQLLHYMFTKGRQKGLIITHGGVIRYLLHKFAPKKSDFWEWKIPHGAAFTLIWTEKKERGQKRCTLLQEVTLTESLNG